jgi:hypothetical protein
MNENNLISELGREEKASTAGNIYMRFGLKKPVAAVAGEEAEPYLVGYAGFANSPAELKHGEAQWKFYNLKKKEDFVNAVKKIMADKTFTAAKGVTVFIDAPGLLGKFQGFGEFVDMAKNLNSSKLKVEYKPKEEKPSTDNKVTVKGKKKKEPVQWANPDVKKEPAAKSTTRHFTVTSPRLMSQLRRNDRVMQYFRPAKNEFVMGAKEFDAFVKAFGREDIKITKKFAEDIVETATAGGTSAGGVAGFAKPLGSKKKKPMIKRQMDEGLAELAGAVDQDHEVQMARADLYKLAKYAIKLHEMLKNVSEAEGLEGWQQAKITKAADYIGSVYHSLEYDQKVMTPEGRAFVPSMSESEKTEYKAILEKAKSKAQQKFMGMVHAAQKGEKPASKEVAKVAKDMPKKAAKDYASTKHKGKPEHVKKK